MKFKMSSGYSNTIADIFLKIRKVEESGDWKLALTLWQNARQIDTNGEFHDYIQDNINSITMLIEAIDEGDKIRRSVEEGMEEIRQMSIEDKKKYAWLIQGLEVKLLTKEAYLELLTWMNKYPMIPPQSIIQWGLDFYKNWKV